MDILVVDINAGRYTDVVDVDTMPASKVSWKEGEPFKGFCLKREAEVDKDE